jgi:DNA-directed RNA polymerase subunit RPC12/RpoP
MKICLECKKEIKGDPWGSPGYDEDYLCEKCAKEINKQIREYNGGKERE